MNDRIIDRVLFILRFEDSTKQKYPFTPSVSDRTGSCFFICWKKHDHSESAAAFCKL